MIKVFIGKDDKNKFLLRQHVGTVDFSKHGLSKETDVSISLNMTSPMIEFPDGIIIGLDFQEFLEACIKKYIEIIDKNNG